MSTKQVESHEVIIPIPDPVKVTVTHKILHVQGPLGKTRKIFKKIPVDMHVDGKNIKTIGGEGLEITQPLSMINDYTEKHEEAEEDVQP